MKAQQLDMNFSTPPPTPAGGAETLNAFLTRTYMKHLQSDSWRVRRKGCKGLGEIGQYQPAVVEALESLSTDWDRRVRETSAAALAQIWKRQKP
jgi:hypothetical protein